MQASALTGHRNLEDIIEVDPVLSLLGLGRSLDDFGPVLSLSVGIIMDLDEDVVFHLATDVGTLSDLAVVECDSQHLLI